MKEWKYSILVLPGFFRRRFSQPFGKFVNIVCGFIFQIKQVAFDPSQNFRYHIWNCYCKNC